MPKFALRSLAAAALAGILITIGGCADSSPLPTEGGASLRIVQAPAAISFARAADVASAVIGPEGGALQLASGHKLVFPAGALSAPTQISMSNHPAYAGVILQPHGLTFPAGAQPVLTLDNGGVSLAAFRTLAIAYVGDSGEVEEVLATDVLAGGRKLRASLPHFSIFVTAGG